METSADKQHSSNKSTTTTKNGCIKLFDGKRINVHLVVKTTHHPNALVVTKRNLVFTVTRPRTHDELNGVAYRHGMPTAIRLEKRTIEFPVRSDVRIIRFLKDAGVHTVQIPEIMLRVNRCLDGFRFGRKTA
jgi:hypothetical protein